MISDMGQDQQSQARFGSGRLLSDLLGYNPRGKFVFIGDNCQLPPVNQSFSPALTASYIKSALGQEAEEVELTQVMRQKDGCDIPEAAERMRNLYKHPQQTKWAGFPMRGWKNIHIVGSQAELLNLYLEDIKTLGLNHSTLITSSNKQCAVLTGLIRPSLGRKSPRLEKGDLLLVTQNNLISGFMNGDLVKVDHVGGSEFRAGLNFVNVRVHDLFSHRSADQLLIEDIIYQNNTNLNKWQQDKLYVDYYKRMQKQGIGQKDSRFEENMLSDSYLNALRAVWGNALTCHKAQGGEWPKVFLDLPRSVAIWAKPYVYQWVYTAMTRASQDLYVVDDFHNKIFDSHLGAGAVLSEACACQDTRWRGCTIGTQPCWRERVPVFLPLGAV